MGTIKSKMGTLKSTKENQNRLENKQILCSPKFLVMCVQ